MTVQIDVNATLDQKAKYYNANPSMIRCRPSDLQNFYTVLPEGARRLTYEMLKQFPEAGDNLPHGASMGDDSRARHSDLYLNQNADEFFAAIDKAMTQVDIKRPEQIQRVMRRMRGRSGFSARFTTHIPRAISNRLTQLYLHLREQGYNHYDLVH